MGVVLNEPIVGSTAWGTAVNANWTMIQNAFNGQGSGQGITSLFFDNDAADPYSVGCIMRNQSNLMYHDGTSAKQFALLTSGLLPVANGGTGLSSYTTGDTLYASGTSALSKLSIGTQGKLLRSSGVSTPVPSWAYLNAYTSKTADYSVALTDANTHFRVDSTGSGVSITNLALNTNVVTITAASHGYATGDTVTVLLVTGTALFQDCCGTFKITVTGSNTFTYALTHANIANLPATGTVYRTPVITLPKCSTSGGGVGVGFLVTIENNNSHTSYIGIRTDATTPDTISGANVSVSTYVLAARYSKVTLLSDGTSDWSVVSCTEDWIANSFNGISYTGTSTQWGDATGNNITLTAGEWDISASCYISTLAMTRAVVGIGTGLGNSQPSPAGDTFVEMAIVGTNSGGSIPSYRVAINAPTNYYLKLFITYSNTTTIYGRISARRIR